jgi:hypothetical protein
VAVRRTAGSQFAFVWDTGATDPIPRAKEPEYASNSDKILTLADLLMRLYCTKLETWTLWSTLTFQMCFSRRSLLH